MEVFQIEYKTRTTHNSEMWLIVYFHSHLFPGKDICQPLFHHYQSFKKFTITFL